MTYQEFLDKLRVENEGVRIHAKYPEMVEGPGGYSLAAATLYGLHRDVLYVIRPGLEPQIVHIEGDTRQACIFGYGFDEEGPFVEIDRKRKAVRKQKVRVELPH